MASIFDTEEKQPITARDLLRVGFRYTFVDDKKIKEGHFYLPGFAPLLGRSTWLVRFYPRGHYFGGKKLRSNRLVYKVFDREKMKKEIKDAQFHGKHNSKKIPETGYYAIKYIRNVGKAELDMVLSILEK